jgi:hypothetical protein
VCEGYNFLNSHGIWLIWYGHLPCGITLEWNAQDIWPIIWQHPAMNTFQTGWNHISKFSGCNWIWKVKTYLQHPSRGGWYIKYSQYVIIIIRPEACAIFSYLIPTQCDIATGLLGIFCLVQLGFYKSDKFGDLWRNNITQMCLFIVLVVI